MCGGLGQYFGVDPVLVRVIFILLAFAQGIGILAYVIMALVVPNEPPLTEPALTEPSSPASAEVSETIRRNQKLIGFVLLVVGMLLLLSHLGIWGWFFLWNPFLALALVAAGVVLLLIKL